MDNEDMVKAVAIVLGALLMSAVIANILLRVVG